MSRFPAAVVKAARKVLGSPRRPKRPFVAELVRREPGLVEDIWHNPDLNLHIYRVVYEQMPTREKMAYLLGRAPRTLNHYFRDIQRFFLEDPSDDPRVLKEQLLRVAAARKHLAMRATFSNLDKGKARRIAHRTQGEVERVYRAIAPRGAGLRYETPERVNSVSPGASGYAVPQDMVAVLPAVTGGMGSLAKAIGARSFSRGMAFTAAHEAGHLVEHQQLIDRLVRRGWRPDKAKTIADAVMTRRYLRDPRPSEAFANMKMLDAAERFGLDHRLRFAPLEKSAGGRPYNYPEVRRLIMAMIRRDYMQKGLFAAALASGLGAGAMAGGGGGGRDER